MVRYTSHNQATNSLAQREERLNEPITPNLPHVYLQTCDRMEWYTGAGEVPESVVRHLFRVVSGLESSLMGETAIQGQVKTAYLQAASKHQLSASLHRLFQTALSVGKKVRTHSAISQGAVSHSQAVIELLKLEKVILQDSIITLLGVNKLNEDVIRFLNNKGACSLFLGNRNLDKATLLAEKFGCQAFPLTNKKAFLEFTDVLIAATSAPHVLIRPEDLPQTRNMIVVDLAFPRDVDESVRSMPNIKLFDLEDIRELVRQNLGCRKNERSVAEQIIEKEVQLFLAALASNRLNRPVNCQIG